MAQTKPKTADNPFAGEKLAEIITRSATKLKLYNPEQLLADIKQGDVLVSRSGNLRLVLSTKSLLTANTKTLFLTRSRKNEIGLEQALLSQVDASKLIGVVRREAGNPLERYSRLAAKLVDHPDIIHNVGVLLTCGEIGKDLQRLMMYMREGSHTDAICLGIALCNWRIELLGTEQLVPELFVPVKINFSCSGLPDDDYIDSVVFSEDAEEGLQNRFMVACVLANTIANARNLAGLHMALGTNVASQ